MTQTIIVITKRYHHYSLISGTLSIWFIFDKARTLKFIIWIGLGFGFAPGKKKEFCYGVTNQRESFIYLNLMIKNREVPIKRSFKWWISIKLM
jgi:hypothetical protein